MRKSERTGSRNIAAATPVDGDGMLLVIPLGRDLSRRARAAAAGLSNQSIGGGSLIQVTQGPELRALDRGLLILSPEGKLAVIAAPRLVLEMESVGDQLRLLQGLA